MPGPTYDPEIETTYRRHKDPGSWGAPCPDHVTIPHAQLLLDTAVEVDGAMYNVEGEYAYRAQQHDADKWHGHPIPWTTLPNSARKMLIRSGRLTDAFWKKAVRKKLGSEFRL